VKSNLQDVVLLGLSVLILLNLFFLLIAILARKKGLSMAVARLILLLLLDAWLLEAIRALTVPPADESGNGNPAYILYLPAIAVTAVLCTALFLMITKRVRPHRRTAATLILIGGITGALAVWQQTSFTISLRQELERVEHVGPQQLNTLYFNYWTLASCVALTLLLAGLRLWLRKVHV
jgi:hypothetical protein